MPQKPKVPPILPINKDIQKSIEIITKCRDVHIHWVDKIKNEEKSDFEIKVGGDLEWHQNWVNDYNFVINTLKSKL